MKKLIYLITLLVFISCGSTKTTTKQKWYEKDSRIEIVNETTVIFRDVDKIEIKGNTAGLITYVYDLTRSKSVKVARGSFKVELPKRDYLIQANKPITKTVYEVIIE